MKTNGLLRRAWVRLFGESDPIARQLASIAREGALLARIAHVCALFMLVLFSAGSLVALAGDSVAAIAAGHATLPAIIAAGVSGLLVACMDTAMLYAASILRLLAARRADKAEGRLHRWVLGSVALLEAATYAYMSYRFEHPADGIAWALIGARAIAAPLLAVYLSLARPLPVMARDMLGMAERISGEGVLRDLATIASDASAPLADKVSLYIAAAIIAPEDKTRLSALLDAAQQRLMAQSTPTIVEAIPAPPETRTAPSDRPPTGPGSPTASKRRASGSKSGSKAGSSTRLTVLRSMPAEERIRLVASAYPTISVRTLAKRAKVSESTASKWLAVIKSEMAQQTTPQEGAEAL